MTPTGLVTALKAEIEDAVKGYKMQAENQGDKRVSVYAQYIRGEIIDGAAEGDDEIGDTYYPLIIVTYQGGKDDTPTRESPREEASVANIGLTFSTYGEDEAAWMDLLNIMEHVRQRVLTKRTVADEYRLVLPIEWHTIETQPYPFWFGYGTLQYTIAQPQESFPLEFQDVTKECAK